MSFSGLKHYLPRSLYGRAALILVIPIVVLQLVVSVAFISNHLEDIINQKTNTLVRVLEVLSRDSQYARNQVEMRRHVTPMLEALEISLELVTAAEVPAKDHIPWDDFSGRLVRDKLRLAMPDLLAVVFGGSDKLVSLYLPSQFGPVKIQFHRDLVTVTAPHQLLVTMVFFGVVMTVIGYLYMRNQLRPVKRLAEAAQAYGRGRNQPFTPSGAVEVRAAGSAFLEMRGRIDRQIEQRTMMLSGVSHDLRTPLTRLKLGLAMMPEDEAEPLLRDVDEMKLLLDAFLEFSRGASTAGDPEETDPQDLVERIVADAQRAGRKVTLVHSEGEGTISLRPVAMRRAVENLLSNAVRYGTHAEVSVVLSEKSLRIRVEDDGPGIPRDQWSEALKPFSRLDPARNQNQGSGVGLGLAIVSDIARAHGGVLRLGESEDLGGLRADIVIAR